MTPPSLTQLAEQYEYGQRCANDSAKYFDAKDAFLAGARAVLAHEAVVGLRDALETVTHDNRGKNFEAALEAARAFDALSLSESGG